MLGKDSSRTLTVTKEEYEELMGYVDKHGFRHNGECYLVATWIHEARRKYLRDERKIIKKVGTKSELNKQGISVPLRYNGNFAYYRLNDLIVIA